MKCKYSNLWHFICAFIAIVKDDVIPWVTIRRPKSKKKRKTDVSSVCAGKGLVGHTATKKKKKKKKHLQKRSTKHILLLIIIVLFITWLVAATFGAGGSLDGGGPLHWARQGRRRRNVLHVVGEAQLVEALRRLFALRMLVAGALSLRAVGVAQHPHWERLVPLDPRIVVADDVLMVEAWEQRHLAFDPSELFAGWVDLDALHGVIAAV